MVCLVTGGATTQPALLEIGQTASVRVIPLDVIVHWLRLRALGSKSLQALV